MSCIYWLIDVYVVGLRVVKQCVIISVHYLFQNYYYHPLFVFKVNSISTTPNKWTPTSTTRPVGPHQDSNGTFM